MIVSGDIPPERREGRGGEGSEMRGKGREEEGNCGNGRIGKLQYTGVKETCWYDRQLVLFVSSNNNEVSWCGKEDGTRSRPKSYVETGYELPVLSHLGMRSVLGASTLSFSAGFCVYLLTTPLQEEEEEASMNHDHRQPALDANTPKKSIPIYYNRQRRIIQLKKTLYKMF